MKLLTVSVIILILQQFSVSGLPSNENEDGDAELARYKRGRRRWGGCGWYGCPCGGNYDRRQYGCCNRKVKYEYDKKGCCGRSVYLKSTHDCCNRRVYEKSTQGCCHYWTIYTKTTHACCRIGIMDLPKCSEVNKVIPDPCSCSKFYRCLNGVLSHGSCPPGGVFDHTTSSCVKVTERRPRICKGLKYRPHMYVSVYGMYTVTVVNRVADPDVTLVTFSDDAPRTTLFDIIAHFAGTRNDFKFSYSFDNLSWYHVTCINDLCGASNGSTTWKVSVNGKKLEMGISSVIPDNGANILFELVETS